MFPLPQIVHVVSYAAGEMFNVCMDVSRWDVVSADNSERGLWEMVVVATKTMSAGEDLWLSYDSRPGSHFLLHYGFV
jgi:hypothetical protein